jgi:ubiquitin-protein ligase E3 C
MVPINFSSDYPSFHFVGKLVGKALYEGVLIEPVLSRVFLNKVLLKKNTFNDLRFYDRIIYNSLIKLKKESAKDMGLIFTIY